MLLEVTESTKKLGRTKTYQYFKDQQGYQFDPELTSLFLRDFEAFTDIRSQYPNGVPKAKAHG